MTLGHEPVGVLEKLGSARAYVEQDAEDAWQWLIDHGLVDDKRQLVFPG